MTLPTPDAQSQSPRLLSQPLHSTADAHSMPPATPPRTSLSSIAPMSSTPQPPPVTEIPKMAARERAIDFADHSWNLATGGLKTLTAKRELPPGLGRRVTEKRLEADAPARSYTFALVILACIVVMLVSGGIVLFMLLQP